MKILILTPLYPPETADLAIYIKRLAKKLHSVGNTITIITYASIPEKIPGVRIITVNKYRPLLIRLFFYIKKLWGVAPAVDVIYAENGSSIELPIYFISFFIKTPIIFHIGDKIAYKYAQNNILLNFLQKLVMGHAHKIIKEIPIKKPEILPFKKESSQEKENYISSWSKHIQLLIENFKNV